MKYLLVILLVSLLGMVCNNAVAQETPNQVEPFALGQGTTEPPATGPYYVGHKDAFIIYYPDCPLVNNIPVADRRYYTSVPPWHRLDPCRGDLCDDVTCPDGQHCEEGECVDDDPCDGVTCPDGQVCHEGNCVDPCSLITCPDGQHCVDGECVDACVGINCGDGFICSNGDCHADAVAAQEFMTGTSGWGDRVSVQPDFTIHPKDLDADHDVDMKDFQIAQILGEWEVEELPWETWPHLTFYIKSNFRYNPDSVVRIDDKIDNTLNPPLVLTRAHVLELPFGWVWRGRVTCPDDGTTIYRNSLLYGKPFDNSEDAKIHYFATKAENWNDAGDMETVDRPDVGTNGLDVTVKNMYLYTFYPDWNVTFTGTAAADGSVYDHSPVKGISLSQNGYELLLNTDPTTYVRVSYNMQVHIE